MRRRRALPSSPILLVAAAVVVSATLVVPPSPAAAATGHTADRSERVLVQRHRRTGKVRFLGTAPGRALPVPRRAASAPPEQSAREFLSGYGAMFGVGDEARELRVARVRRNGADAVVRFQQVHRGVPVLGGELAVAVTGDGVRSANGEVQPQLAVDTVPRVPARVAARVARAATARAHPGARRLRESAAALAVLDPALLGGPAGPARLVWRSEVTDRAGEVRDLVLVDARTATVALRLDQRPQVRARRVCDRANVRTSDPRCLVPVRAEGQAASPVADVNHAYDNSGAVYDFFFRRFGRDSVNGKGAPLVSTVRYCPPSQEGDCPYDNAYWNGEQMVFGSGLARSDDVVAHEFTHALTEAETGLFYWYQSGAINESLSDVFGEIIDQLTPRGSDGPAAAWKIGEDLGQPFRDMADPPRFGDPDRMGSGYYWSLPYDNGGVHTNSGVGNKTAHLIAVGTGRGTFNGRAIRGLGLDKTARIYYALLPLLTSGSDYADLYDLLPQACRNSVGRDQITVGDCAQVEAAVAATELNRQPTGAAAEAALCPQGRTAAARPLFAEDFESEPGAGGWRWDRARDAASGEPVGFWPDDYYATSGSRAAWAAEPLRASDRTLTLLRDVTLPPGASPQLHFRQSYALDPVTSRASVQYSLDSGATWHDLAPLWAQNGYTGGASPGFRGDSRGYGSSRADLSRLGPARVRLRFRLVTAAAPRNAVQGCGWYVDDVVITACLPSAPGAPTRAVASPGDGRATVRWTAPTGGAPVTGYVVRSPGVADVRAPGGTTSAVVGGLRNGTAYRFTVTATNGAGSSPASTPSAPVTPEGARLTIAASPATVAYGGTTTISGRLTTSATGSAIASTELEVYARRRGGSWPSAPFARARTDATGRYHVGARPASFAEYAAVLPESARWRRTGSPGVASVAVRPAMSLAPSATRARRGTTVWLAARVAPNRPGRAVSLQQHSAGAWRTVATGALPRMGAYRFRVTPSRSGTYSYRLYKPSDADHAASTSRTVTLHVS